MKSKYNNYLIISVSIVSIFFLVCCFLFFYYQDASNNESITEETSSESVSSEIPETLSGSNSQMNIIKDKATNALMKLVDKTLESKAVTKTIENIPNKIISAIKKKKI
ncbi:hypothetical protein [Candidatus Phytoplasma meliae]|uniref:Uncharacterized protein n=1 Tax=Candidatus Phytoplasma meliae TaxID=1848402 RepID=A0ABS5CXQ2_9MOLU|nr:hypothetical protein [Candidatus Phytoplasma meliae]MBP5835757.1 hypothetical protein [Candidatus Phytoplasma meliae]